MFLVEKVRLELTTYCLQSSRSNQLNYNPVLVGSAGVEPEQTAPKTVVLTITPQASFVGNTGLEPSPSRPYMSNRKRKAVFTRDYFRYTFHAQVDVLPITPIPDVQKVKEKFLQAIMESNHSFKVENLAS